MTEMMTETIIGLQVPESFVSVAGSGCLRLHLPAFPGAVKTEFKMKVNDFRICEKTPSRISIPEGGLAALGILNVTGR